jgi:hypothetical protein
VYIFVKHNFLVVSQYLKICNLLPQSFLNFQFTPLKAKQRRFGVRVKRINLHKKKSHDTHVFKILSGLTDKPDGMTTLTILKTLAAHY